MNKISVLMSLYKKESPSFLRLSLVSLVNQTRLPDQVVIVFDGPVGGALEQIVDEYAGILPITKVKLDQNAGLAQALNKGLANCSGDLVARMDTDDICLPERLEKQEHYITSNRLDIVGTAASVVDFTGEVTGVRVNPERHEDIVGKLWCNPFIHPSVMFVKASLEKIGAYDSGLRRRQDYELWFRAAKNGLRFGNLQDKLIEYRFDQHTLQKQSPKLAWDQGKIGFIGSMSCKLGLIKSFVCFVPFVRSLLPIGFQMKLTQLMRSFDSRTKY
ncbi:glycosyltransferase [Vibrio aestuarianus]|uniref:glycosyltransferase n=1 Tax=Vibrio aestuarianus TaxID=28171 RepID=UPI001558A4A5|nr:glycosyltransferase [Vibrio aestuarianus]NGZ15554.1 glycosyltransferase [Vibrio aestuarianus]NKZ51702.1 glycosyltransferase [Vibrio aestuarianus]